MKGRLTHVDHIGIAVRSLDAAIPLYRDVLGLELELLDEVEEQGVKVAFFRCGETMLELLEPTRPDSPIAKYLEKRGEGIHHVALATDDIEAARERAAAGGLRLLSEAPLDGAHGKHISFVHPKDTRGVLLEFCAHADDH
ncbi:MAG: methylmalonyl-CoA epimerase [Deltaproteobacteria bacterium]|nr:MAG: methylmalonyl-CoA epimerase [Deltaproteobacteria bacterium]